MKCTASDFLGLLDFAFSSCLFLTARVKSDLVLSSHVFPFQLDGYIARNVQGQKSLLGSIIDPLADKLLLTTLFVTLTYVKLIPCNFSCYSLSFGLSNMCFFLQTALFERSHCLTSGALAALVILRDVVLVLGGAVTRYRTMERPVTLFRYFSPSVSPLQVTPTVMSKVHFGSVFHFHYFFPFQ